MTHNVTGLKYLGQTQRSLSWYNGSGRYWKKHLKKHGLDLTKEILAECKTKEELSKIAQHYSDLWNVCKSEEFANLCPETGTGGDTSQSPAYQANLKRGRYWSKETREKASKLRKGIPRDRENVERQRKTMTGTVCWNNGKEVKRQKERPGPEWVRGRLDNTTGIAIEYEGKIYPSIAAARRAAGSSYFYSPKFKRVQVHQQPLERDQEL
jgi:hypothetical protein